MYIFKMSICVNTSIIPIFRKLRKEDHESKASLGYVVRSQLKTEAEMGGYVAWREKGREEKRRERESTKGEQENTVGEDREVKVKGWDGL